MKIKKFRYFMCDFETTVFKGQTFTEVWASACVELYTDDVKIFHSISEQLEYFKSLNCNIVAYYHNLKFDGAFWLSHLLTLKEFKQAVRPTGPGEYDIEWLPEKEMPNNSVKYSISDKGQWYSIIFKINNHIIELRDSLKLLPFSVKRIGESFGTKHKKLDLEYDGYRYAGCEITSEEQAYIANDVLVVKEALEIMFDEGHDKLTIGSCCLSEYKKMCKKSLRNQLDYEEMFPNMYDIPLKINEPMIPTVGDYIRKSYRGGWCYLAKGKESRVYHNGTTADVNSLYPSVMSSESGSRYPVGKPTFWFGNFIPDEAVANNHYYFVRIKTRFYLKDGMLPFIQIKHGGMYAMNESLESSDIYDEDTGKYYSTWVDESGEIHDTRVELTLTMTDYELIKEHYELVDFEILDGCWFYSEAGIFDEYIDKYKKEKQNNTGAKRELAKLFLNNLYGKMASSTVSSFKYAYIKDGGILGFVTIPEYEKKPGYIPVGSAITSYARNFTIRAAQKNYHGVDNPGFIYADTDSIHCDLPPNDITGIKVDDKAFCCWKLESCWDEAIFARQKTYIEHVTHENLKKLDEPYYNIKCAGMPDKCKKLFEVSLKGDADSEEKWSENDRAFLFDNGDPVKRELTDFCVGLEVPGKLMPKRVPGGVLLTETTYKMR